MVNYVRLFHLQRRQQWGKGLQQDLPKIQWRPSMLCPS